MRVSSPPMNAFFQLLILCGPCDFSAATSTPTFSLPFNYLSGRESECDQSSLACTTAWMERQCPTVVRTLRLLRPQKPGSLRTSSPDLPLLFRAQNTSIVWNYHLSLSAAVSTSLASLACKKVIAVWFVDYGLSLRTAIRIMELSLARLSSPSSQSHAHNSALSTGSLGALGRG